MLYCALCAPHLTPRAQVLTFLFTAEAGLLPLDHGVAWTFLPMLNKMTRLATAPDNLPTTAWGQFTTLITLWLGY